MGRRYVLRYAVLRPASARSSLHPPAALASRLLALLFLGRLSIVALLVSGFAMVFLGFGGFATCWCLYPRDDGAGHCHDRDLTPISISHLASGFDVLWLTTEWSAAEKSIRQIRLLVGSNLVFGLVNRGDRCKRTLLRLGGAPGAGCAGWCGDDYNNVWAQGGM